MNFTVHMMLKSAIMLCTTEISSSGKNQMKKVAKDVKQTAEDLTSHEIHTLLSASHTRLQPFYASTCFQQLYKVLQSCK